MNQQEVIEVVRQALLVVITVAGPIMAVSIIVGVGISIFQSLTQIQEQTLTFVPKLLAMVVALVFFAPYMMSHMSTFTEGIMDKIIAVGMSND